MDCSCARCEIDKAAEKNHPMNGPEFSYNPKSGLHLIELLSKCKCDLCKAEMKRLQEKYGLE